VKAPDTSRKHEDRFRCPQCGRIVTVTARFRRREKGDEALVRFECTMDGMCGSPIWDPCPMYVAYMERAPQDRTGERQADSPPAEPTWENTSLDEAW
jgi:hypothetical protein